MSLFADYMHHRDHIVFYKLLTRGVEPRLIAKCFGKPVWFIESISSMPTHVHDIGVFNNEVANMYDPFDFIYQEYMRGLSKIEIAQSCLNKKVLEGVDLNLHAELFIDIIINYIDCESNIHANATGILASHNVPEEDINHAFGYPGKQS